MLYLVNPYNVTWGIYALTLDLFLNNAAFFLVLTMVIRLLRGLLTGRPFRRVDAVMLGIGLGLAAPTSFPNVVRTLVLEAILLGAVACVALVMVLSSRSERRVALVTARRFGAFSVPPAAALLAYPFYQFLTNWFLQPAALAEVAARESAIIRGNAFNTLAEVVRLLGRRNFQAYPYYPLYVHNLAVIAGTWFWPLLAFAIPLLLSLSPRFRDRIWVWTSELILLPCIIWGTGAQPPFGPLNTWIAGQLPFGPNFMPPFFPIQLVAIKLYCVLIAFSVGAIYLQIAKRFERIADVPRPDARPRVRGTRGTSPRRPVRSRGTTLGTVVATGTCIVVVGMLMVASLPIFEGTIFELRGGQRGDFFIPPAYFAARGILHSHGDAGAMLFPAVSVYVGMNWSHSAASGNYSGASGWYNEFNYPSPIVDPAYYGPYSFLLNTTRQKYLLATEPIVPGANVHPFGNETVSAWTPVSKNSALDHYPLSQPLNLTPYEWLNVTIPTTNPLLLAQLMAAGEFWIGLHTNRTSIGWYVFGQRTQSPVLPGIDSVSVGLVVNGSRGDYDHSYVNGIIAKPSSRAYFPLLGLGPPTLVGVRDSMVQKSWLSLMDVAYHVRYILVDFSIAHGATQPFAFVRLVLETLEAQGLAEPVFLSAKINPQLNLPQIELWALN